MNRTPALYCVIYGNMFKDRLLFSKAGAKVWLFFDLAKSFEENILKMG